MNYNLSKIRIKCAEVLGYTNVREPIGPSGQIGTWWGDKQMGQWNTQHQIPNYPESADAALELVAWMAKDGWAILVQINEPNQVTVSVTKEGGMKYFYGSANTFPLAVCLAFLKANNIDPESL